MRCTSPRTVGFKSDGKTISWSKKSFDPQYATFELPCGKCIECRLEYARSWSIRCIHESQMYSQSSFITLTYSEENLSSDKLYYADFQLFIKRLRDSVFQKFLKNFGKENWKLLSKEEKKKTFDPFRVGMFVTGEYGGKNKRPHWHAIIFNWWPEDAVFRKKSDCGEYDIYTSKILDNLWGKNNSDEVPNQVGTVTLKSAGYVARYAAKAFIHGDEKDKYKPISKKSSHQAIGKKYLEKFWSDIFSYGYVVVTGGEKLPIPRYYIKWLQKNKPEAWKNYVTQTKERLIEKAKEKESRDLSTRADASVRRVFESEGSKRGLELCRSVLKERRNKSRNKITKSKFKQLQERLKL